jgi:ribosome maturation factor RimP
VQVGWCVLSKSELWDEIEPLLKEAGLDLFDIDMPNRQAGVVRVLIAHAPVAGAGVTVDECAAVSRKLSVHARLKDWLAGYRLEVSSPGINRRLQLPQHFAGAVGERVQITAKAGPHCGQPVVGRLTACGGGEVVLELEDSGVEARFGLDQISKARVDYLFK